MKRAFLFGLAAQFFVVAAVFLIFDDMILPSTRSPIIGIVALGLGAASVFFAWGQPPHPSWPVTIGLWVAGFLGLFVVIPIVEILAVLTIALIPG